MRFEYTAVETQAVEILPELRPAAERYWAEEGGPGEDSGNYIFFGSVIDPYIEVLLAMPEGGGRDRLLARAYGLVEQMLGSQSSKEVRDLAYIEILEWMAPWWYARSLRFLGPNAMAELDRWEPRWRTSASGRTAADPERDVIDLYGVRDVILAELRGEGFDIAQIPGISAPRRWEPLVGIEAARAVPDAVAFVSCFGTSVPYVLCPVSDLGCDEAALSRLAEDLADVEHREPNQRAKAQSGFYRIAEGERVWGMTGSDGREHSRWTRRLWIADRFIAEGLDGAIRDVVAGRTPGIAQPKPASTRIMDRSGPSDRTEGPEPR